MKHSARKAELALLAILALLASASCQAECVRWTRDPNAVPTFDGPGSWGKLQDTVTLDCLSYTGSVTRSGVEHVLIRDERGDIHVLKIGDFMGEHTGRITRIDERYIYIEQHIKLEAGGAREVTVRFHK